MRFNVFFIVLVGLLVFLAGCDSEDTSCLTCSDVWQDYTDRAIANAINTENSKIYLQDMRFPAVDLTTNSVNDPVKTTYKGFIIWGFQTNKYQELESSFQYPHIEDGFATYVVIPHFHWTLSDNLTTRRCIVWGVQYSCANIGDYFYPTVTQKKQFCLNAGNTANLHIYSVLNNITVLNRQNSRQCFFRIFRDGTNTSFDNMTNTALLAEFDIHYYYKKYGELIG